MIHEVALTKRARTPITKGHLEKAPIKLEVGADHAEIAFRDRDNRERRLTIYGVYNTYTPDIERVPSHYWWELHHDVYADATPAARRLLEAMRDQLITMIEDGELPKPAELRTELEVRITVA